MLTVLIMCCMTLLLLSLSIHHQHSGFKVREPQDVSGVCFHSYNPNETSLFSMISGEIEWYAFCDAMNNMVVSCLRNKVVRGIIIDHFVFKCVLI